MSLTIAQVENHLKGMGHGSTLNKVRNIEEMFERSASRFLLKCHPIESIRTLPLSNTVHDDVNNYSPASDFGSLIDLIPQDNRNAWDLAVRTPLGEFDLQKAIRNKTVAIEGSEGSKILRINWKSRQGKLLNSMDSLTSNGTWAAVNSATGLKANSIFKKSGNASIEFDIVASGDGISNIGMDSVDMTDEDEVADVFVWVYLGSVSNLTSITGVWGNDITTKYWTSVAQTTQVDGTSFKVGWNLIKLPWSTATETGTVDPTTIDSFKITFATSGAIANVRVDNIVFSIGRNFDHKYYSKYLFRNSAGTWISKPTSETDTVMIDNDTLPLFLLECLTDMAQQMEGSDSAFDIGFAEKQLAILYPAYKGLYPSQVKKQAGSYGSKPSRGRW
jgi:hypothetical protein